MHRFRKRSDAKRSLGPEHLHDTETHEYESLPELPPASNFRTSLILPGLSRRFTLLRKSTGDPVSLEDLRTRFAEQRARGGENQISEEEEDMILETLSRLRANTSTSNGKAEEEEGSTSKAEEANLNYTSSPDRQSVQSTNTVVSSIFPGSLSSSPSGRSTKRYSNNLFGSGRFRDYTYVRNVSSQRARSTLSSAPSESSLSLRGNGSIYSDSIRPVTPDSAPSSSVQSSPNEKTPIIRSAPLIPPTPYTEFSGSAAEYRLSKTLAPSSIKRASLALEEVIKEIEEEAEDEIVMPRSTPVSRTVVNEQNRSSVESNDSSEFRRTSSTFEAGTAISSDKQVLAEPDVHRTSPVPHGRPGTASPTPRLPGYIPGMPRPMTPRDISLDPDDPSRSHSTTPRATSPLLPTLTDSSSPMHSPSLASGLLRQGSNASTSRGSPLPHSASVSSPHFSSSSQNGPFIPDDYQRSGDGLSVDFENTVNSTIFGRRRAASPLAGPAYQPMAVSSRPSTPSNVIWNPANTLKSQGTNDGVQGHNRNDSWASDGVSSDPQDAVALGRKSTSRSLRSPDSLLIDRGHLNSGSFGWNPSGDPPVPENQPESPVSGFELNSISVSNLVLRSPTPTQTVPRSPASPTFSHYEISSNANGSPRSSKPNAPASPLSFGPLHPLVFSPLPISSRSSLESAGSSYHSLEGERHKDRGLDLFNGIDPPQAVWHDISPTDKSSSVTPGGSPEDELDTDDIIGRYAGLTKSDFVAIQEKLVGAAMAKTSTPETRDRAPSLRRRRPSTSQSNYSLNGRDTRVASPPPQAQSPASLAVSPHNPDKSLKASALLDSVVDSIQSPRSHNQIITVPSEERTPPTSQSKGDISPTSRKNRDLAQALFGVQDRDRKGPTSTEPINPTAPLDQPATTDVSSFPDFSTSSTTTELNYVSPAIPPSHLSRTHQRLGEQGALEKEVQRKAEAATLALRNVPSPKSPDTSTLSRRKISPHQISTPRLVSASTSVDTIPLPTPSVVSGHGSKIGQRIRRLRGTLRAKAPTPAGDEVTPYPLNSPQASPDHQTIHYDPAKLSVPGGTGAGSATEPGRSKMPFHSPPASGGPGLKGFMARFRKQRPTDISLQHDRRETLPSVSSAFLASASVQHEPVSHQSPRNDPPVSAPAVLAPVPPKIPGIPQHTVEEPSDADDALARRQIFDAASNLGLDQATLKDLNDLLSRSKSTASSRSAALTMLTRNNSTATSFRTEIPDEDARRSPPISGRPSMEEASRRTDDTIVRKLTPRKPADHVRKPRDTNGDGSAINAIVRRTIIYPSESRTSTIDLNVLLRKNSQSTRRRRSASANSVSSRSVQDRAPTPPPPRSPTARRFSTDTTPPLPQLPPSFSSQAENLHPAQSTAATGPIEKSSSTYDSLYEMYAGETKATNSAANDGPDISALTNSESGPALEVVELANGETIWSIVNGLRDDDDESVYGNRASFASEYSTRETSSEGVQVFFKDHVRTGSKGSNASFLSRKKSPGKPRPETKVFYSSSAQIGKLIENLSQGMESGSFNFQLPNNYLPGRSNTSSFHSEATDMHWTVEERLEHMLSSIGAS